MLCISTACAVVRCASVYLSVLLSHSCIVPKWVNISYFYYHHSSFSIPNLTAIFRRGPPNGASNAGGYEKITSFNQYLVTSRVVNVVTVRCYKMSAARSWQVDDTHRCSSCTVLEWGTCYSITMATCWRTMLYNRQRHNGILIWTLDLHMPYSRVLFWMILSDLEQLSEIFNDTKHHAASQQQLSCLLLPVFFDLCIEKPSVIIFPCTVVRTTRDAVTSSAQLRFVLLHQSDKWQLHQQLSFVYYCICPCTSEPLKVLRSLSVLIRIKIHLLRLMSLDMCWLPPTQQ